MNKTKFLVLAIVVAVMLMGAGYAWWNETVTIENKVTTGILDVDVVSASAVAADTDEGVIVTFGTEKAASYTGEGSQDNNDTDSLVVNFDNLYPDADGVASIEIKNVSDMKVKLDRIVPFELDTNAQQMMGHPDFVDISFTPKFASPNDANITFTASRFGDYYLIDGNQDLTLGVGESLIVTVKAHLDKDVGNSDENKANIGLTLKPNFIQWNQH